MKTLLLLIFSAITLAIQAQTSVYHPFPDTDAVWNVGYNCIGFNPSCHGIDLYSYTFSGDTLIKGTNYHKVYVPAINCSDSSCFCGCQGYRGTGYHGAIRQDTGLKKVWVILKDSSSEELLYDFNLNVGDTMKNLAGGNTCLATEIVDTIDSVLVGNNYRKRWNFRWSSSLYDYVIEGIGGHRGLLEPCDYPDYSYELICFKQNGVVLYHPDTAYSCSTVTLDLNDLPEKNIIPNLFPNPATNQLTITTNTNTPSEIIIYDIASRKLMEEKFIKDVSLNIAHLAKGVYLYQITNERGMVSRGKVVKE